MYLYNIILATKRQSRNSYYSVLLCKWLVKFGEFCNTSGLFHGYIATAVFVLTEVSNTMSK